MPRDETCPSCGHELEPGLNECPGCGDMAPLRISLDSTSLGRQVAKVLLIVAVGLALKLFLMG